MPVSNSSPLIHLSRLGKLGFARQVFPSFMIPPAVREETIEAGKSDGYSDALNLERLEKDGWLKTSELSQKSRELAVELADAGVRIAAVIDARERLGGIAPARDAPPPQASKPV